MSKNKKQEKWSQGFDFMVANEATEGLIEGLQAYDWLRSLLVDITQDLSIDDILRALIVDADLTDIVSALDLIASESNQCVRLYEGGKQIYPLEA